MSRLVNTLRSLFLAALNNTFPSVRLLFSGTSLVIPPDGFGAVEENLAYNIYFNRDEIGSADTIIDLGAHVGTFTIWTIIHAKKGTTIIISKGFKVEILTYKIGVDLFYHWVKAKPRPYASLIAIYRLIVSTMAKPTVTIVKAKKNSQP